MSERDKDTSKIEESLRRVGAAAAIGTIPGETHSWCDRLLSAFRETDESWQAMQETWSRQLAQAAETDLALAPRVDELSASSKELVERRVQLFERGGRLKRMAATTDKPNNDEPVKEAQELRHDVLHWLADCIEVRGDIEAWTIESAFRDRGVVD